MDDLYHAKCFMIHMDSCTDRKEQVLPRIYEAGFTNVQCFPAVDARIPESLEAAWKRHSSIYPPKCNPDPKFESFQVHLGEQGCLLSHLDVWKKIIDEKIPLAVIFEDDVRFHQNWNELCHLYYDSTPKDWDLLFLGAQIDHYIDSHILKVPVFCTHAYVITLQGANKLYEMITQDPDGFAPIDYMLIVKMQDFFYRNIPIPFQWYVWNGLKFPDPFIYHDKEWFKRNTGLVFQDRSFGTYVKPRPYIE